MGKKRHKNGRRYFTLKSHLQSKTKISSEHGYKRDGKFSPCHLWVGTVVGGHGRAYYGRINLPRNWIRKPGGDAPQLKAHRVALMLSDIEEAQKVHGFSFQWKKQSDKDLFFLYNLLLLLEGLTVDHLCCRKLCINPLHLEWVTREENQQRKTTRISAEQKKLQLERARNLRRSEAKIMLESFSGQYARQYKSQTS